MSDDLDAVKRVKRFKHQSYAESLKQVHLPSALDSAGKFDHDIADDNSYFYDSLHQWRQLNLSPAFVQFANKVEPLSASMPMLLHNWRDVVQYWQESVDSADHEALPALLDLFQKLAHDLRTTLSPVYASLLHMLLTYLPRPLPSSVLTSLLATLSSLFRYLLIPSIHLDLLHQTWSSFSATLPKCNSQVQRAAAEVWASVLRRLKTKARERALELMATELNGVEDASAWILIFACKSVSHTLHTASPSILGPVIEHYLSASPSESSSDEESLYILLRRTLTALIHHCDGPGQFSSIADVVVKHLEESLSQSHMNESEAEERVPGGSQGQSGQPEHQDLAHCERVRKALRLSAIVCGVRQGSRLSVPLISHLLAILSHFPIPTTTLARAYAHAHPNQKALESVSLEFVSSLFIAATASTSPNTTFDSSIRTFLQRIQHASPQFFISLVGVLSLLGWQGGPRGGNWLLIRDTLGVLHYDERGVLRLVARFVSGNRGRCTGGKGSGGGIDVVWKRSLSAWVVQKLGNWTLGELAVEQLEDEGGYTERQRKVEELHNLLALAPCVEEMPILVVGIVDRILGDDHANNLEGTEKGRLGKEWQEWRRTYASDAYVLGACLRVLAEYLSRSFHDEKNGSQSDFVGDQNGEGGRAQEIKQHAESCRGKVMSEAAPKNQIDARLAHWTRVIVERYVWSESALSGLAMLLRTCSLPPTSAHVPYHALTPLHRSLGSHSRAIRLSVLQILTSHIVVELSSAEGDVLRRCLQGEEVPLDAGGVRERVLRIGRVGMAVRQSETGDVDGDGAGETRRVGRGGGEECARWLMAQLKVNLRPLWSPAAEALSSLVKRLGDPIWSVVWEEFVESSSKLSPSNVTEGDDGEFVPSWLAARENQTRDHRDDDTWEEERSWRDGAAHNVREAVAEWLDEGLERKAIVQEQRLLDRFDRSSYEVQLLTAIAQCPSVAEKHNHELVSLFLSLVSDDRLSPSSSESLLSRGMPFAVVLPRPKLVAWLTLFSKFSNPRSSYASSKLHSLYLGLLAHPDRSLQSASIRCILTYKSPSLTRREDSLWRLLDSGLWRDELASVAEELGRMESEVVGVVMRMLFGIARERKGRGSGVGERRAAVLSAFGGCKNEALALLVDLMLAPMEKDCRAWAGNDQFSVEFGGVVIGAKQQIGYLNMLGDVLRGLGARMVEWWPALFGTTVSMVATAQTRLSSSKVEPPSEDQIQVDDRQEGEPPSEDNEWEEGSDIEGPVPDMNDVPEVSARDARTIRQLGLRRLADFFRASVVYDFSPFLRATFDTIISPRLAALDEENTQAPSALLEIFASWSVRHEYAHYLVQYDDRVVPKVLDCLVSPGVKPAVVNFVLDFAECLLTLGAEGDTVSNTLVAPHLSLLLRHLTTLVKHTHRDQDISTPLAQRQVGLLAQLAHHIGDGTQAEQLLGLLTPLLRKPARVVPERTKVDMLRILGSLVPLAPSLASPSSASFAEVYEVLSHLFLTFRSNVSRAVLAATFSRLSVCSDELQLVAALLDSLNASSTKRVNEADFDRRLAAFATLNDQQYEHLTRRGWLPVLYNALHFIQDAEELAIRTNAAFTLRRFIGVVVDNSTADASSLLLRVVLPALKGALRCKHELVRAELLGVLAHAVPQCTNISSLQEMRPLLAGGDEEASFFTNIYHIQTHRRTRALRRLGDQCDAGVLSSRILVDVFVPVVEYYVASTTTFDHLLVAEAINTLGRIARRLRWPAYYSLVQKYLRGSRDKGDTVKVHVRALVSILENFHFSMEDAVQEAELGGDMDVGNALEEELPLETTPMEHEHDVKKVSDAVNLRLLPALLEYLSNRDENEDSLRIPIALGVVKIAKHLPAGSKETQVTRLLTVLSQALRSRSQDTRDLVRETVCRVVATLGPSYLAYAMRELRAALVRGPHLHVLAFVTHAILNYVTAAERQEEVFTDLDGCVDDIAHVASEVVFGESGKDVQHEDFKTKMREVRGSASKGLDTFALTAKYVSPGRISALLRPLRSVMEVTTSAKPMQQVDEVLRRVANGLNSNARLDPPELLVLCHTLINQNAKFLQEAPVKPKPRSKGKKDDAVVQMKCKTVFQENCYAHNSYRFVVFGLEVFNIAFRRSKFNLHDSHVLARLEPFVVSIGNTLYAKTEAVLIAALKAVPAILQCSVKAASSSAALISRQILVIIRSMGSTESEVTQTAFKSLATILRECPSSNVKETDLLFLLEILTPDLEEPSRQAGAFALLRAIVSRKLVVPELYDLMTTVSSIVVTSQSPHTREAARSLLLQFLLDYPQGSGRLQTTLTFFARNVSFEHVSGRLSVLELLHAVITKLDANLLAKHAEMLFIALVLCIANDDEKSCRESAANVVQSLLKRLADEQKRAVVEHLHAWATESEKARLRGVAAQVYGLLVGALQRDTTLPLTTILMDILAITESARTMLAEDDDNADHALDWQMAYHALQTLSKLLHVYPELTVDYTKVEWTHVFTLLSFPHPWVRNVACRLLGLLFAAQPTPPAPCRVSAEGSPLTHTTMRDIAEKLCTMLKSPNLEPAVALQVVKNLFFVGKWFSAHPQASHAAEDAFSQEDLSETDENNLGDHDPNGDPLPWLFSKLSFQARSAHIARKNKSASVQANWPLTPLSVFRFFAAMTSHMDGPQLEHFLPHILTPVHRIIEEDDMRDPAIDELKATATELMDLVQAKVGTTAFANVYNRIRQNVLGIRQARRVARATRAMTDPQVTAKRKIARNAMKKESRKRKNRSFADNRGRSKRRREE
ncbi:armadillo-type protein [Pisolithus thermaeus]|nr:armadillo-type protein [Pisolithus croceorrhizus]KAI6159227.1 armadillo-type protein [Pisolithus thermaeus]